MKEQAAVGFGYSCSEPHQKCVCAVWHAAIRVSFFALAVSTAASNQGACEVNKVRQVNPLAMEVKTILRFTLATEQTATQTDLGVLVCVMLLLTVALLLNLYWLNKFWF